VGDFATIPGKKLATLQLIADKVNAKLLEENKEAKTLSAGQVECVHFLVLFPIEFALPLIWTKCKSTSCLPAAGLLRMLP